ncbi:MAG: M23 family metallopeptidase [Bacillota bacterium]
MLNINTGGLVNSQLISSFKENKSYRFGGIAAALVIVVLLSVFVYNFATKPNGVSVIVDGKVLGVAQSIEIAEIAIDSIHEEKEIDGLPLSCISTIKYEPVRVKKDEILPETQLVLLLKDCLEFHYGAMGISVNGEVKVIVENQQVAQNIIEAVKEGYMPSDRDRERYEIKILDVAVEEKVAYVPVEVDKDEIIPYEEAVEIITYGQEKLTYHEVKSGESLWSIAQANGLQVKDLEEANPELQSIILQIGQKLRLIKPEPIINVKVVYEQVAEERIPYQVKYVNNDSLWRGQQRVENPGASGKKEVTYLITRINGNPTEKIVLNEKILEEPKTKVVAVGTKMMVASRGAGGTGPLGWPIRGAITSPFGYRGRTLHTGIDIAGNTGDPIYAAEDGTVIFSSWHGNYGNLAIIDHGDGVTTYYAHASQLLVKVGQTVQRGDVIARVGSTGNSTGPHLHFEVRINGTPDNPTKYLRN